MNEDTTIIFQFATHFLSRIALRLEYFFKTITEACHESHELIHRFALKSIIEILELIERPEVKSRFLKELIRIEHVLKKTNSINDIPLFRQLEEQIYILSHVPDPFGSSIQEDLFLKSLRQIHQPNTQECEFNSPQLVLWFNSDALVRQNTISHWLLLLKNLENTVHIYLNLLREATQYAPIITHNGFYQYGISPKSMNHLILLKMDKSLNIIPKLQLGHHNLTIRLYDGSAGHEIHNHDIAMEIGFSQL